jgi:hypothetical protein
LLEGAGTIVDNVSSADVLGMVVEGQTIVNTGGFGVAYTTLDQGVTVQNEGVMSAQYTPLTGGAGTVIYNTGTILGWGQPFVSEPGVDNPQIINEAGGQMVRAQDAPSTAVTRIDWTYTGTGSVQSGAFILDAGTSGQFGDGNPAMPYSQTADCDAGGLLADLRGLCDHRAGVEFADDEVDHRDEVAVGPVSASAALGGLDQ